MTTSELEFFALGALVGALAVVLTDWWSARRRVDVQLRLVKPRGGA